MKYILLTFILITIILIAGCSQNDVQETTSVLPTSIQSTIQSSTISTTTILSYRDREPQLKEKCEMAGGNWRQFPNACADACRGEYGGGLICGQSFINACECGPDKCWAINETCVLNF